MCTPMQIPLVRYKHMKMLVVASVLGACVAVVFAGSGTAAAGISDRAGGQNTTQAGGQALDPVDQPNAEREHAGTGSGVGQPPRAEQHDDVLDEIKAVVQGVTVRDLGALGQAFKTKVRLLGEASRQSSATELIELGDLDGDGVSEVAVKWQIGAASSQDTHGQAAIPAFWGAYLLSWDGGQWKPSRLGAPADELYFKVVWLGKSTGRCIAVVSVAAGKAVPFPALYQMRGHEAVLLWDSQAEDSRYNGFERGQVEFPSDASRDRTDMVVSGRADPGLLEFQPGGRRGFSAQSVYHWDGRAYIPVKTEYTSGPDYTLYRFIAALHLHDFRSAYSQIDPGKFLNTDTPSLDKFRQMMKETFPEFLDDEIFQAREADSKSPDALVFELPKMNYVYRPSLGKGSLFLLTGLERKVEISEPSE